MGAGTGDFAGDGGGSGRATNRWFISFLQRRWASDALEVKTGLHVRFIFTKFLKDY